MNLPIICFEGPSGIGKTTLSNYFVDDCNIVPEVNQLFKRNELEPRYWYLERQVDRYELCITSNKVSILDGDLFQPIWYNWACGYPSNFLSKNETHEFYKNKLSAGSIAFPDLYIIFYVDIEELWIRKKNDLTRQRRNFEKHLDIIEPMNTYFRFLENETPIEIKFIHFKDIDLTIKEVSALIENICPKIIDPLESFEKIEDWMGKINL